MKAKSLLLESEKLTQIAKNIFGDIVNKVYYHDDYYHEDFLESTKAEMSRYLSGLEDESTDTSISIDFNEIVIDFTNGKRVIFSASDFGDISKFEGR